MVLALTTTFTPSPSCTEDLYFYVDWKTETGSSSTGTWAVFYIHLGPTTSAAECLPPSFSEAMTTYYENGVCPEGYTKACGTGSMPMYATCCPSGYECQTIDKYPWYSTNKCTRALTTSETVTLTKFVSGSWVRFQTVTQGEGFNAFGIPIQYTSPQTASSSSTASASTAPPSSASASATATETSTSSPSTNSSGSSGLSSGGRVGVGVGVGIGGFIVLALLIGAFFLIRRRKATSEAAAVPANTANTVQSPPHGVYQYGEHQSYYDNTTSPYAANTQSAVSMGQLKPLEPPHVAELTGVAGEESGGAAGNAHTIEEMKGRRQVA